MDDANDKSLTFEEVLFYVRAWQIAQWDKTEKEKELFKELMKEKEETK